MLCNAYTQNWIVEVLGRIVFDLIISRGEERWKVGSINSTFPTEGEPSQTHRITQSSSLQTTQNKCVRIHPSAELIVQTSKTKKIQHCHSYCSWFARHELWITLLALGWPRTQIFTYDNTINTEFIGAAYLLKASRLRMPHSVHIIQWTPLSPLLAPKPQANVLNNVAGSPAGYVNRYGLLFKGRTILIRQRQYRCSEITHIFQEKCSDSMRRGIYSSLKSKSIARQRYKARRIFQDCSRM